jgi:hypothetical protein
MSRSKLFLAIVIGMMASAPAAAAFVFYDITNVAQDVWEYQYSIEGPVEEFSIYFDLGPDSQVQHANLEISAAPDGWDPLLLLPDPGLPHAGLLDGLALLGGLLPEQILDGFAVRFSWLGDGVPPAQRWEFVDPRTFDVLASGITSRRNSVSVTEPNVSWLLLMAGFALLVTRHRFRTGRKSS